MRSRVLLQLIPVFLIGVLAAVWTSSVASTEAPDDPPGAASAAPVPPSQHLDPSPGPAAPRPSAFPTGPASCTEIEAWIRASMSSAEPRHVLRGTFSDGRRHVTLTYVVPEGWGATFTLIDRWKDGGRTCDISTMTNR